MAVLHYAYRVMRLQATEEAFRFADEVVTPLMQERKRLDRRCMLEEPLTRQLTLRDRDGSRAPRSGCGG